VDFHSFRKPTFDSPYAAQNGKAQVESSNAKSTYEFGHSGGLLRLLPLQLSLVVLVFGLLLVEVLDDAREHIHILLDEWSG